MPMRRVTLALLLALTGPPAHGAPADRPEEPVKLGLDLRYRYEGVDQEGFGSSAQADTLRIRGRLETRERSGFSAMLEGDVVTALGAMRYDDTRNGETAYPVVADPVGADLNQAWLQYAPAQHARLRIGRQRINLDNQRFVGASDWRQNEQTFDALRFESTGLRDWTLNYVFVDRVNRVFGPDAGTPPASLNGASHLLNAKLAMHAAGEVTAYAYLLDFDDAPQLSSDTFGARYEGTRAIRNRLSAGWALEYARQQDAGDNPLRIDASYSLLELRLRVADIDFLAAREVLSGARGDPAVNRAFQTPLATLHKWQGWADKFLVTPPGGIEDTYVGIGMARSGWRVQASWHDFAAEAGSFSYGSEVDVVVARKFARQYELLLKFADYDADEGFTDTRKLWVQLGASF